MKKHPRKLALHRETVKTLTEGTLQNARGGVTRAASCDGNSAYYVCNETNSSCWGFCYTEGGCADPI